MSAGLARVRFDELLRAARERNASDVHLSAGAPPGLRIDGALQSAPGTAPSRAEIDGILHGLLDENASSRFASCGDVTITYRTEHAGAVRIHAARTSRGPALALRLLAVDVPALETLRLPEAVRSVAGLTRGLVLFTGPTGSGKSTALAALVDEMNRHHAKHVVTIEDPIEYEHRSSHCIISQREVGRDVATFSDGVHAALRCDPDVLLIGEMRDASTMQAALSAAETGHLVLGTLHTGDAPQTVERIIGAFAAHMQNEVRAQLAQTLAAVFCLRLVPRSCGTGRRAAVEVLVATDAVRTLIRDGKSHQIRNAMLMGRECGMQTLESHLTELVARGDVALDAARRFTERVAEVR